MSEIETKRGPIWGSASCVQARIMWGEHAGVLVANAVRFNSSARVLELLSDIAWLRSVVGAHASIGLYLQYVPEL